MIAATSWVPPTSIPDQEKVFLGNTLLFNRIRLMTPVLERGMIVVLENPKTSRLWLVPELQDLIKKIKGEMVYADFCQHGKPWKKSTAFLVSLSQGCRTF